eukprot:6197485-Pleurochrysis_carterae.AAC.7
MRGGSVLFTPARDVVKPDVNGGGLIVQLYNEEGGNPYPLAVVEGLVHESDGVLQGLLSQGNRQGSAASSLRAQNCPAKMTPVRGKSLRAAVALSVNKGGPQEYPLQAAMVALGLQWMPLQRQGAGAVEARGEQTQRTPQLLQYEWLAGAHKDERVARRHASQARMVGLSARVGEAGVLRPRTAAQLLAAAAGDMAVVDGVEAVLLAAAAVRDAGAEKWAAMARMRHAGAACTA